MKIRKDGFVSEIKSALADPNRPEHQALLTFIKEGVDKIIPFLPQIEARNAQLKQAEEDADKLMHLVEHGTLADIAALPLQNGLAALFFVSKLQSKIAKAGRTDALQKLILNIVKKNPTITKLRLVEVLSNKKGLGIVVDIDDAEISFHIDRKGNLGLAPISGLKDRLSRAKKKLSSR